MQRNKQDHSYNSPKTSRAIFFLKSTKRTENFPRNPPKCNNFPTFPINNIMDRLEVLPFLYLICQLLFSPPSFFFFKPRKITTFIPRMTQSTVNFFPKKLRITTATETTTTGSLSLSVLSLLQPSVDVVFMWFSFVTFGADQD